MAGMEKLDTLNIENDAAHHAGADAVHLARCWLRFEEMQADNPALRSVMTTRPR